MSFNRRTDSWGGGAGAGAALTMIGLAIAQDWNIIGHPKSWPAPAPRKAEEIRWIGWQRRLNTVEQGRGVPVGPQ